MHMALPVIMLLMIMAALSALLITGPEPGHPLDALITSSVHEDQPDQPSAPRRATTPEDGM